MERELTGLREIIGDCDKEIVQALKAGTGEKAAGPDLQRGGRHTFWRRNHPYF